MYIGMDFADVSFAIQAVSATFTYVTLRTCATDLCNHMPTVDMVDHMNQKFRIFARTERVCLLQMHVKHRSVFFWNFVSEYDCTHKKLVGSSTHVALVASSVACVCV